MFINILCISAYYAEETGFSGSDRSEAFSWFIYTACGKQFGLCADRIFKCGPYVTGNVLCEPERFGRQVFHVWTWEVWGVFSCVYLRGHVSQGDLGAEILWPRGYMERLEDHCTVLAFFKAGSLWCLLSEYCGFSV